MDLTGKTIGEYQLIELIHRGQNTIYKGFQPSMNRYVAVKVLRSSLADDPAFVQRFQQDMQLVAGLEHPNVLPIYDFGQQDGLLYIVTRYVETGTLKDRLPPAFSLQQAQSMVTPIAGALDYIHSRGVVHGNLKPSNILIDPQGRPLLADLGYAQGIDHAGQESVYLSPEQVQRVSIDQRTDVYALGVLLYQMLVSEPPPLGATPSPRLKRPDLPVEVEKVILKAMAQNPDQRFQSAGQLRYALDAALAPKAAPVPASAAKPAPQATAPAPAPAARRGPSWVLILVGGLVILCLLAVCAVAVIGGLGGRQPAAPAPTATTAPGEPAPEPTPPGGSQPDGSLIQGLFDLIESIFQSIADIINSILGGGGTPEPPGGQPPTEQPPEEPPPPEPEQLPEEQPAEG